MVIMNKWLKGLLSAIIGGAANSITVAVVEPASFNLGEGLPKLVSVAAVSAIVAAAMYLKQSPLPGDKDEPPSLLGNTGHVRPIPLMIITAACWTVVIAALIWCANG
jgi:hypothetical protein